MAKYIDKDALVAEIEKRIKAHKKSLKSCGGVAEMILNGSLGAYQSLLHFLNTVEVKEEVTPTNDFVEKAVDYIANNMQCSGYTLQTKAKFIRDFKKHIEGKGTEKENKVNDLCHTCKHYWEDSPMQLDSAISHCEKVDEKYGFKGMNEFVAYPCVKCPFNCYSPKKK